MRKRSKYRPKPVHLNSLARVLEAVAPIGTEHADHLVELKIKNHLAMQALTRGEADKRDMSNLIDMANIMEALRLMNVCAPLADEIAAGRRALIDISVRAAKVSRFVPTGPEMGALNTLIELHDELIQHMTLTQLEQAVEVAKRTIRRGEATVLPNIKGAT